MVIIRFRLRLTYLQYNFVRIIPTDGPCICTREYSPVCYNGRNFGNKCEAICAGARDHEVIPGLCDGSSACVCPKILDPVCLDGVTYTNRCLADCAMTKSGRLSLGVCDRLYFRDRRWTLQLITLRGSSTTSSRDKSNQLIKVKGIKSKLTLQKNTTKILTDE